MIITLTGATATKHLGGLNFYSIIVNKSSGVTVTLDKTTVSKDTASTETVTGTLTVADGYTLSSVAITMGGTDITSSCYTESTGAISITGITGNIVITAKATSNSGSGDSGEDDGGEETTTLTLYQGYANENAIDTLATRVRTDFIDGAFSVECNSGYQIRAIYQYASATATGGTAIVTASENKTSYSGGTSGKYYIITFCKTDASASILPTENIVKSFTGTIYSNDNTSGDDTTTTETIEVSGIKIAMGQILSASLNTAHTGRAYTVDTLNDITSISTEGSSFVMIPIIDSDDDLTNGSTTLYTATDGTFNNTGNGSLTYHSVISIADIKAIDSTANIYVMFKHSTASSFALSDLASAVTIS